MAIRTNHKMVEDVLQQCWDSSTKLDRYIRAASLVVDRVEACAIRRNKTLTAAELREMETWLAAHFYTKMDPTYSARTTASASGQFIRDPDVPEPFKDGALMIDYSGCLDAILKHKVATATWLGKPVSEQTAYRDRD